MGGETEKRASGWTTDTLHSHMSVQFTLLREQLVRQWADERRATDIALGAHDEALRVAAITSKEAINAALNSQKEATSVQAETLKQYQATQNEWRESLNDVSTRAYPRPEAEAVNERLTRELQEVRLAQLTMITRAEYDANRARDAERLGELATRINTAETAARTAQAGKTSMIAFITVAVAVLGLIIVAANAILR